MNDLQEPEDYDKVTEIRNEFGQYEVICYHETWFLRSREKRFNYYFIY